MTPDGDYAHTMRVLGEKPAKAAHFLVQRLPTFSVGYRLAWYGVDARKWFVARRSIQLS
jgi:hypothetical protein